MAAAIVKRGDEGNPYEIGVAIDVLRWLSDDTNNFHDFKFGVQLQDDAQKFDDIVIGIKASEGDLFKYSMFQLKYRSSVVKECNLGESDLIPHKPKKSDAFYIKNYFESFMHIYKNHKNGEFQDGELDSFFLFTNRGFSCANSWEIVPVSLKPGSVQKGECYKLKESCIPQVFRSLLNDSQGKITSDDEKCFKIFCSNFFLAVDQPNNEEINEELKTRLGEEYPKLYKAISDFGLKTNLNKWIQKRKLFAEASGKFQGKTLNLSTLLKESLYPNLDQDTILKLITNTLTLADPKPSNDYKKNIDNVIKNFHIQRTYLSQNVLKNDVDLQQQNDTNNEFHIQSQAVCDSPPKKRLKIDPQEGSSSNGGKKNHHYIEKRDEKSLWIRSEGKIDKILALRTNENTSYSEDDIISNLCENNHKFNILADEPGAGKSVALFSLAKKIKIKLPMAWVEQINLVDLSPLLNSEKAKDVKSPEAALDFLLECIELSNEFEKSTFKENLESVVLLMDGYDELCLESHYKSVFLDWIKNLKKLNVGQIWISARCHLKEELEKTFCVPAFSLSGFTRDDQINFLLKVWKPKEKRMVEELIEKVSMATSNGTTTELCYGIPLYLSMVAEIYKDLAKTSNPPNVETLVHLFKNFTDQKFRAYINKEYTVKEQARPDRKKDIKMKENTFVTDHELFAVYHLFPRCRNKKGFYTKEERKRIIFLTKEFEEKKENRGLLFNITNKKLRFLHRAFAEFFAAQWFLKHLSATPAPENRSTILTILQIFYFEPEFQNFRKMFGLILADGCDEKPHQEILTCIILKKVDLLKQKLQSGFSVIFKTDALGRNALHVAIETEDDRYEMSVTIIDALSNKANKRHILQKKDVLFSLSPLQYLSPHLTLTQLSDLVKVMCKNPDAEIHPTAVITTLFDQTITGDSTRKSIESDSRFFIFKYIKLMVSRNVPIYQFLKYLLNPKQINRGSYLFKVSPELRSKYGALIESLYELKKNNPLSKYWHDQFKDEELRLCS